jgi:hypothetical protein
MIDPLTGLQKPDDLFVDPTNPDNQAAGMLPTDTMLTAGVNGGGGSAPSGKSGAGATKVDNSLVTIPPPGGSAGAGAMPTTGPLSLLPPEQSKTEVSTSGPSSSVTSERVAPSVQNAANQVGLGVSEALAATEQNKTAEQAKIAEEAKELQVKKDAAKEEALRKELAVITEGMGQREALEERNKAVSAANTKIAEAQKRVDTAYADTQKGAFTSKWGEVLAGIMVAASRRNLRAMGENPANSGVAATVDNFIAADKAKKMNAYLKSKEFLADAQSLPGKAKQAEAEKRAELAAATAQELKILAARTESLSKSAEADPNLVKAQADALKAKALQEEESARIGLLKTGLESAQVASPNVKVSSDSGKTTTSRTDVDKPGDTGDKVTVGKYNFNIRGSSAEQAGMRKKAAATDNLVKNLDELYKLIDQGADPLTTGEQRAKIQTRMGQLTGQIKESEELGALDNGVIRLVESQIGDPLSLKSVFSGGSEGAKKKVELVKQGAKEALASSLVTHGNDPQAVREAILGTKPDEWRNVTRDINGVKYERTGPGPKDWRKVK